MLKVHLFTDATAAIGICRRRGLGKIRHLHVSDLWAQDRLKRSDFSLSKIAGSEIPADILTKYLDQKNLQSALINMISEAERPESAHAADAHRSADVSLYNFLLHCSHDLNTYDRWQLLLTRVCDEAFARPCYIIGR